MKNLLFMILFLVSGVGIIRLLPVSTEDLNENSSNNLSFTPPVRHSKAKLPARDLAVSTKEEAPTRLEVGKPPDLMEFRRPNEAREIFSMKPDKDFRFSATVVDSIDEIKQGPDNSKIAKIKEILEGPPNDPSDLL